MRKLLKRRSGEGYIDVCVLVVCAMLVLALVVRVLPVYITKQQLDTYAVELVREAEIAGRVGTETTRRAAALTDSTGLDPDIRWSATGRIQLNDEVTVTLTLETDIGLFGGLGSFIHGVSAGSSSRNDGNFVNRHMLRKRSCNDCVTCFVVCRKFLFFVGNDLGLLCRPHLYLANRLFDFFHSDIAAVSARRNKCGFVQDIFKIRRG